VTAEITGHARFPITCRHIIINTRCISQGIGLRKKFQTAEATLKVTQGHWY